MVLGQLLLGTVPHLLTMMLITNKNHSNFLYSKLFNITENT